MRVYQSPAPNESVRRTLHERGRGSAVAHCGSAWSHDKRDRVLHWQWWNSLYSHTWSQNSSACSSDCVRYLHSTVAPSRRPSVAKAWYPRRHDSVALRR